MISRNMRKLFLHPSRMPISKYFRFGLLTTALVSCGASIAQTQDTVTTFTYDSMGNVKTASAPLGRNVSYSHDALNRLTRQEKSLASGTLVTTQSYDGLNQVSSVTDPRNLITAYSVDGLGNTNQLNSPDTQLSTYTVDEDGHVLTATDARGKTTRFQYDALGRLLQEQYQSGVPSQFEYDGGPGGPSAEIGNLTRLMDESGSTAYTHDAKGRVLTKTQIVSAGGSAVQLLIQYTYGTSGSATGKLESITYPSGIKVGYHYDDGGQVSSITLSSATGGLSEVTLLTDIVYTATGEILSWHWNSPVLPVYQRVYDLDGRLISYPTDLIGTVRTVNYDAANRVTSYVHTGGPNPSLYNQTFGYDLADRLTNVTQAAGTTTYGYDANGNRTQQTGPNVVYSYDTASNRLRSATSSAPRTYSYDAAGNRIGDGVYVYTYSDRGRLAQVRGNAALDMYYNALGQRVLKAGSSKRTYYAYDEDGHLLGEYDQGDTSGNETVYLGDLPVAVVAAQQYFYVVADHINTPLVLAQQNGTTVWDWRNRDPFGNNVPISSSALPSYGHRFPGQVADTETGLFYNQRRDYDPQTGRYLESDPIGLEGGINTYAYVNGSPVNSVDPTGEFSVLPIVGGIAAGLVFDHAVKRWKEEHCKCQNASTTPGATGNAAGGAVNGAFGDYATKPRTGIAGGGAAGMRTSVYSQAVSKAYQSGIIDVGTRRTLRNAGRVISKGAPFLSAAMAAYEMYDAYECN